MAVESDPGDGTAAVELSFDDGETWTSGAPCPRGWCADAPRHATGTVRARLSLAADPAKARGPVVHAVTFTPRYVRPESIAACLTTDVL